MGSSRRNEFDFAELLSESGRWPAGTQGTVVEVSDSTALVEIDDDRGHALDYVSVPHDALAPARSDARRAAS